MLERHNADVCDQPGAAAYRAELVRHNPHLTGETRGAMPLTRQVKRRAARYAELLGEIEKLVASGE